MGLKFRSFVLLLALFSSAVLAREEGFTEKLSSLVFYPERSAAATTVSLNESVLSAQIQARINAILVGVSQPVKQGETLVELDCTDFRLAYQLAKTNVQIAGSRLKLAKSQKDRFDRLLTNQLTSQESTDTSDAEYITRKGELQLRELEQKRASIDVNRCQIVAPFDGIVTARLVSEGQLASVGTALIEMVEMQRLELSAQVRPGEVEQIQQAKELWFDNGSQYPATLTRAGGVIDSATRTQEIRLRFAQQSPLPGSAGLLVWQDSRPHLDAKYIVERDGQLGVFVDRKGQAEYLPLPQAIPGRPAPIALPLATPMVIKNLKTIQSGDKL
ncbi:MAG: efflux RND transporter periplasmic adaptor subunit [Pseudomonadales bacterium]|nr:efflux RND transporter periplasmic adaptor subunit [Pseudomonadales bacterium]